MKKVKSFGLIEAVAASTIIILIASGALVLSSTSMKTSALDQTYLEAENIAEFVFEKVQEKKSQGEVYFIKPVPTPVNSFIVKCFDNSFAASNTPCFESAGGLSKTGLGYRQSEIITGSPKSPVPYGGSANPAFMNDFFQYSVEVVPLSLGASTVFPENKIVSINVEVTWDDIGGAKKYYARQYFADWER